LLVLVVGPKQAVEFAAHGHQPVLAALAIADMDHLLDGVDVASLKQAGLGDPEAGRVDQGEEHAVLGVGETVQEPLDLNPGQDRGERYLGLGDGDPGDLLWLAQRPGVQEFQGGIMLPKPGRTDGLLAENIHPAADTLLAGVAQVVTQELLEPPGRGDVGLDGAGGAIRHPEVAGEPGQSYTDCHCSPP